MRQILRLLVPASMALTLGLAVYAQPNFNWVPPNDRALTALNDQLSVVTLSMPGNVAVLSGPDGILLVDNQMPVFDAQLVKDIEAATGQAADKVRFIINTHFHPDHLGSNAIWKARGATNVAHHNVRVRLGQNGFDPETNSATPPAPEGLWPVVTYGEDMTLHLNGETVHVVHAVPAHTDGDSIVYFENANAVHTGDLYLNKAFPVVDTIGGGSLDGLIEALEGIASRINHETRIIPGHGPISNKVELQAYTASVKEMRAIIGKMVEQGMSPEAIIAAKPLARFEDEFDLLTGFFGPDVIVAMMVQDISETN